MSDVGQAMQLGTARTHDELVDILAARKEALGLSNRFIDTYWSYAEGMTDKYLGPTRIKTLGRQSLDDLLMVLGVSLLVVESPEKIAHMERQWEKRKPGYAHSPRVSKKSIEKAKPVILRENGAIGGKVRAYLLSSKQASTISRKGGRGRAKSLTKRQRSDIARKGATARWKKARETKKSDACLAVSITAPMFQGAPKSTALKALSK